MYDGELSGDQSMLTSLIRFEFTHITQVWVYYFKLFSRENSTQDQKVRFIKGNQLKITQVELLSSFILRVYYRMKIITYPSTKEKTYWYRLVIAQFPIMYLYTLFLTYYR